MPELPDLEVFSKNLNKEFAGKTLKHINVKVDSKLNAPIKELQTHLQDQPLKKIYREGKELYFEFANQDILSLHLMLKGQLYLFNKKNDHKYTIIEMIFDDQSGLCLTDFQRQATPKLNPDKPTAPDALSKTITAKFLTEILQKNVPVKKILMDQHVIRGIGNAYADEILWEAGISPFSISSKIPAEKIRELTKAIKSVLKNAEKEIIKKEPGKISGEIRDFLVIHNSRKSHSPGGSPILVKDLASRKTYYTNEQELFS
jgi:formamidopyrimidine-DNA glycosylase